MITAKPVRVLGVYLHQEEQPVDREGAPRLSSFHIQVTFKVRNSYHLAQLQFGVKGRVVGLCTLLFVMRVRGCFNH